MLEPHPKTFTLMDYHVDNGWFHITVVTPTVVVVAATSPPSKGQTILQSLNAGSDPIEILKANSPFGQGPRIVPLADLESIEWHADDQELYLRYADANKGKSRRVRTTMSASAARRQLIDTILGATGACEQSEVPASIWHIGITPLIISGFAIVLFGIPAIAGFIDPRPVNGDRMSGRGAALKALFNAVGPVGMALIGAGIITLMMIWWAISCRKPPIKHIAKIVRS